MEKMVKITTTIPESIFFVIKGFSEREKFDFSYEYLKNEETLEEIFSKINNRFDHSNFYVEYHKEIYNAFYVAVVIPKKGVRIGVAKCNPADNYDYEIGYYLALTRACGWKDLEEELLSAL